MLSSFCARCDSRRDATTPSSASCRSVLRPPLCVLCEDIAEGRRKLLEDRHFRSAHRFVPVIMSSHRFRGWSILPSSSPRPPSCIMGDDALITATSWQRSAFETVFRIENARGRAFVVREAGGRNFRLGIIRAPPPLWRISGWFIAWFACSLDTFFLSFLPSFSLVERGGMLGGWLFTRLLSGYGIPFKEGGGAKMEVK